MKGKQIKIYFMVLAVMIILTSFSVVFAGYIYPPDHGIKHCVLMYPDPGRNATAMKPYTTRMQNNGDATTDWLFDTYIFLKIIAASGYQTDTGPTTKSDWVDMMDRFFDTNLDINALDDAIAAIESETSSTVPSNRKVVIGMPWPNPNVTDFGDVDGDSISENLSTLAGREKVMQWYVDECISRFNNGEYDHLTLWGFYWIREFNDTYTDTTGKARDIVHNENLKLMWIPYYKAPGYSNGYDYFDVIVMQPNYAFNSWVDGGECPRTRLDDTARICQDNTFGFEIESRYSPQHAYDDALLTRYLNEAGTSRLGYKDTILGYFLDISFCEDTYGSSDSDRKAIYQTLCDFVTGTDISDPDSRITSITKSYSSPNATLVGSTGTSNELSFIDLVLDKDKIEGWQGIVTAELKTGAGNYSPVGWKIHQTDSTEDPCSITIPVKGSGDTLRIITTDWVGSFDTSGVKWINCDCVGPRNEENYCLHKKYEISPYPHQNEKLYPDNSNGDKLIDGTIDNDGWPYTKSIGWLNNPVVINLDLGSTKTVTEVELYVIGGGKNGVNWPSATKAAFASDKRCDYVTSGVGGFPSNFATVDGGSPTVTYTRASDDKTGRIDLTIPYSVTSRYISVSITPEDWLMLSEIKVKNGDNDVSTSSYWFTPMETHDSSCTKKDDGKKLVDAVIPEFASTTKGLETFAWGSWENLYTPGRISSVDITVDLEATRTLSGSLRLYAIGGGKSYIYAPQEVEFFTSSDGTNWTSRGTVEKPSITEDGTKNFSVEYKKTIDTSISNVKHVRARVTAYDDVWNYLSEFQCD